MKFLPNTLLKLNQRKQEMAMLNGPPSPIQLESTHQATQEKKTKMANQNLWDMFNPLNSTSPTNLLQQQLEKCFVKNLWDDFNPLNPMSTTSLFQQLEKCFVKETAVRQRINHGFLPCPPPRQSCQANGKRPVAPKPKPRIMVPPKPKPRTQLPKSEDKKKEETKPIVSLTAIVESKTQTGREIKAPEPSKPGVSDSQQVPDKKPVELVESSNWGVQTPPITKIFQKIPHFPHFALYNDNVRMIFDRGKKFSYIDSSTFLTDPDAKWSDKKTLDENKNEAKALFNLDNFATEELVTKVTYPEKLTDHQAKFLISKSFVHKSSSILDEDIINFDPNDFSITPTCSGQPSVPLQCGHYQVQPEDLMEIPPIDLNLCDKYLYQYSTNTLHLF